MLFLPGWSGKSEIIALVWDCAVGQENFSCPSACPHAGNNFTLTLPTRQESTIPIRYPIVRSGKELSHFFQGDKGIFTLDPG